ncbi:AAA family ATPase [Streptomyces sp. NPDC015127]|uniref:AAA family ATPase n=1 Tax=Streptomyces sp. NPDC015127 TaxID=3364939 RepID=UPI0036F7A908
MRSFLDREEQAARGLVGTVGISTYACEEKNRPHVAEAVARFAELAGTLGFGVPQRLEGGGTRADVEEGLSRFTATPAERKILYWSGHGAVTPAGYELVYADGYTPDGELNRRTCSFTDLAAQLSQDPADVLLIVDACFAEDTLDVFRAQQLIHQQRTRHEDPSAAASGSGPGFAIICTAGADQTAEPGRWVDWLDELVRNPDARLANQERLFHPTAQFIAFGDLLDAIEDRARDAGAPEDAQLPVGAEIRRLRRGFLRNPHFHGDLLLPARRRPEDDSTWLGRGLRADTLRTSAPGAGGRSLETFSGREQALARAARWLEAHDHGLLAVTGPAGSGKTMFLSYLVHLTVRAFVAGLAAPPRVDVRPRLGSVHAALHCDGRTAHDLAAELCRALVPLAGDAPDAEPPPGPGAELRDHVAWVARLVPRAGGVTVVVDGLDEAAAGQSLEIARELVNPLAALRGVKVVVGTRVQPRRSLPGRIADETLHEALRQTVPPLALDQEEDSEEDIARHVAQVLATTPGSPYARSDAEELRVRTAERVAARSNRIFLVAHLCARELARQDEPLPEEAIDGFVDRGVSGDLGPLLERELLAVDPAAAPGPAAVSQSPTADPPAADPFAALGLVADAGADTGAPGDVSHGTPRLRAREVLRPLALAQGGGLQDVDLWLGMADVLRDPFTEELTEDQIRTVVERSNGALTVRFLQGDQETHRLLHPGFAAWLLAGTGPAEDAHRRIFDHLHDAYGASWSTAPSYVLRHLPEHAAQGGRDLLERLLDDEDFLVRADPAVLLPLVDAGPRAYWRDELYRRVADAFRRRRSADDRRALLRAETLVHYPERHRPAPGLLWQDIWTDAPPQPPHLRWPGPAGGAYAVHWTAHDESLIQVSGRGEVVSRRSETGRPTRVHRSSSDPWDVPAPIRAVRALGSGHGRTVAAVDQGAVLLWHGDESVPRYRLFWGGSPESLTAAAFMGSAYLAASDGDQAMLWRWREDSPLTVEALTRVPLRDADGRSVTGHRLALVADEDALLLLASRDGRLGIHRFAWRAAPGGATFDVSLDLGVLTGVTAVAATSIGPSEETGPAGVWLAAADARSVQVWRLTGAGSPGAAAERVGVVPVRAGAIALGHAGGVPLLAVKNGTDGLVTVRRIGTDAIAESHFGFPAREGHASLAFDPAGSGRLAVADGEYLHVLYAAAHTGRTHRARPQKAAAVVHLADGGRAGHLLCRVSGPDVLLTAHSADRAESQTPLTLPHPHDVGSVTALATPGGWIVASAAERTARLWSVSCTPGRPPLPATPPAPETELALPGEHGDEPLAGSLCRVGPELHWFVPGRRCLDHFSAAADAPAGRREWRRQAPVWLRDAVHARWTASVHAPDGRVWLAADCTTSVKLWQLDRRNGQPGEPYVLPSGDPAAARRLALGVVCGPRGAVPLIAGTADDHLWLTAPGRREPLLAPLPDGLPQPTGLAVAGPPCHPLVFACGTGAGASAALFDVVGERWTDMVIPYRGYDVETIAAGYDGRDVLVVLEGRNRCDQLLLPGDRLAARLGLGTAQFTRRWTPGVPAQRSRQENP